MRATSRIANVSINTVTKLLVDVGAACQIHNEMVQRIVSKRVCDEIWSLVYAKEKNVPEEMKETVKSGDV